MFDTLTNAITGGNTSTPSAVDQSIAALNQSASDLGLALSALLSRLQPVCISMPPEPKQSAAPVPSACPLTSKLDDSAANLVVLTDLVQTALSRLCL